MAEEQQFEGPSKGRVLHEWSFPAYEQHDRSLAWYIFMGVFGVVLLVYSLFDGNFLFAVIILLTAVYIYTNARNTPEQVPFRIHETGLQIADDFYLFKDIENFAIIYEPPEVKTLYIVRLTGVLHKEFSIPLLDQDPVAVRAVLLNFVEEDIDRENESRRDRIHKVLKI